MLSKGKRLERQLFAEILKSRNLYHGAYFSLRYLSTETASKFGVSVSKKVAKSAVARNTLRRRAYSTISRLVHGLNPGLYLFVAKNGADKLKGERLKQELEPLLKTAQRG